ncbi:sensor histidine kinase [Paenibacillus segetis]|uniref:Sensor histidine kinase n=1 Tax=Paenibacillus segetis TaxID=1325360 RepID=A0ABQ1Y2Z8_9BACL|nr:sensor histidine kinase [Paenibacillus segetis]GGH10838.1 sensor histidine kinase [Paenibacillus segetis]
MQRKKCKRFPSLPQIMRKFKIQNRLTIIFLVVSVIPILFIGFYSYSIYSKSINEKLSKSTFQALTLLNKNMLTELNSYQFLAGSVSTNSTIQERLAAVPGQTAPSNAAINITMDNIYRNIYPAYVQNVRIINSKREPIYELGYDGIPDDKYEDIIHQVDLNTPYDSLNYVKSYRTSNTIVLGRKINDLNNIDNQLGYVFVFIGGELFSKVILSSVDLGTGSNIMIMDKEGKIMSSSNKETLLGDSYYKDELFNQIKKQERLKNHSFTGTVNGHMQQVSYINNSQLGWYLVSTVPFSYINSETSKITTSLLIVISIIIVLCILIILVLYASILKPIRQIIAFCNQISYGDLSNRIEDYSKDEMAVLANKINSMVAKIEQLMKDQKSHQKRRRSLELQMLQSQINPHFLFNTLNSLRWLAIINQVPVLSDGISSLAELLRSTIINQDEQITIEQELQNLDNYFAIQKIRYADNFDIEYDLDKSLLHSMIPKLILQPIAENAIIHGVTDIGGKVLIQIRIYLEDEHNIAIEIMDNGKGFDTTKQGNADKLSGIGITNVAERIKLQYGDSYGLFITSTIGQGTSCKLTIPR